MISQLIKYLVCSGGPAFHIEYIFHLSIYAADEC